MFKKPNRPVNKVFIHCSDSDLPQHDNIKTINQWHIDRGFKEIGYHFLINKKGEVLKGRDIEKIPAAQEGHNTYSIAICLSGKNEFSEAQFSSLKKFCNELRSIIENITFHGHREINFEKTCPNFDYKTILNLDNYGKMMNSEDIKEKNASKINTSCGLSKKINLISKNMDWKEIIAKVAPSLGSAITNPLGFITDQGIKLISKALTGKTNSKEEEIAQEVSKLSTSELTQKLLDHELEMRRIINDTKKIELEKLKEQMKNVQSARDEMNFLHKNNQTLAKGVYYLAFFVVISSIIFFISASLLSVFFSDEKLHLIRETILIMEGMAISVLGFFFGSSYSKEKE